MIELNEETYSIIVRYFNILKDFSAIDSTVKISLRQLALGTYEGCVDTWINDLVETLFSHNLEFISDEYVEDVEYIRDLIKGYNESFSSYYYNDFLETYGYDECKDESILNSNKYKEDYAEYYLGMGVREIRLFSPLIKGNDGIYGKFLAHVPALVELCLKLDDHILISVKTRFDKRLNKNIILMYVMAEHGASFSEDHYPPDTLKDFELLLKQLIEDLN